MNPKPGETPPAPAPSDTLPAPSLPKSEEHAAEREAHKLAEVPAAFRQLHELERLQSERIEQLFRVLLQDRAETLATVREMQGTMRLAQEMMGQADQLMSNLGEAVAALVRFAPMIQELLDLAAAEQQQ